MAYQTKMANCVPASASVFAEARPRQVRLRSSSYDGTRRRDKTAQHIEAPITTETTITQITKVGFIVKLISCSEPENFRPIWIRLSPSCRLCEPEAGGFAHSWIF